MTNLHFRKITLDIGYGESIREGQGWRKDTLGSNPGKKWELSKGGGRGNGEQCICSRGIREMVSLFGNWS